MNPVRTSNGRLPLICVADKDQNKLLQGIDSTHNPLHCVSNLSLTAGGNNSMKALMYKAAGVVELEDIEQPVPLEDESLIKVRAVGI